MKPPRPWIDIDLRTLAAYRVALAAVILIDLVTRAMTLDHYTDSGPVPAAAVLADHFDPSLHFLVGSAAGVLALFALEAAAAVALLVGWRTRLSALVVLVLHFSLYNRNPLVYLAGDALLMSQLFWANLLPLGARWSLDARRAGTPTGPGHVRSLAAMGLIFVPSVMFLFSVFEKVKSPAWRGGEALGNAFLMELSARPLGLLVASAVPGILPVLTWTTLVVEAGAPLLMVLPFARARSFGAVSLVFLMIGIWLTLLVGLFPVFTIASLLPALLGAELWDRGRGAPAPSPRLEPRRWETGTAAVLMTVTLSTATAQVLMPKAFAPIADVLERAGLHQEWRMFHSLKLETPIAVAIEAVGADGTIAPLIRARRPGDTMGTAMPFREGKLLASSILEWNAWARPSVGAWLCRRAPAGTVRARIMLGLIREKEILYAEFLGHDCTPAAQRE